MKKYFLLIAVLGFLFSSCDEEEIPTHIDYVGGNAKDNLYFNFSDNATGDSVLLNLKKSDVVEYVESMIVSIPVKIMGKTVDFDRPVHAVLNKDSSTVAESDYEIQESFIPAGKANGTLNIKLLNSESLKTSGDTLRAVFNLIESEYFSIDYNLQTKDSAAYNSNQFRVFFYTTLNVPPRLWAECAPMANTAAAGYAGTDGSFGWKFDSDMRYSPVGIYMGAYSAEKMNILINACGVKLEDWEFTDQYATDLGFTDLKNRAAKVFSYRFGGGELYPTFIFDRWKVLVKYYLSKTPPYNDPSSPDYVKILWAHDKIPMRGYPALGGWGYLN